MSSYYPQETRRWNYYYPQETSIGRKVLHPPGARMTIRLRTPACPWPRAPPPHFNSPPTAAVAERTLSDHSLYGWVYIPCIYPHRFGCSRWTKWHGAGKALVRTISTSHWFALVVEIRQASNNRFTETCGSRNNR
jgi:hypothetical protein